MALGLLLPGPCLLKANCRLPADWPDLFAGSTRPLHLAASGSASWRFPPDLCLLLLRGKRNNCLGVELVSYPDANEYYFYFCKQTQVGIKGLEPNLYVE